MKDDRFYLLHIRDAARRATGYAALGKDRFDAEPMIQDALMRTLEIIGEAVKHLSEVSRQAKPEIPWKRIAGMRDVLIHHYFGVDAATVWETATQHVPVLLAAIEEMLADGEA